MPGPRSGYSSSMAVERGGGEHADAHEPRIVHFQPDLRGADGGVENWRNIADGPLKTLPGYAFRRTSAYSPTRTKGKSFSYTSHMIQTSSRLAMVKRLGELSRVFTPAPAVTFL